MRCVRTGVRKRSFAYDSDNSNANDGDFAIRSRRLPAARAAV